MSGEWVTVEQELAEPVTRLDVTIVDEPCPAPAADDAHDDEDDAA
jgi:hypothetical protein